MERALRVRAHVWGIATHLTHTREFKSSGLRGIPYRTVIHHVSISIAVEAFAIFDHMGEGSAAKA